MKINRPPRFFYGWIIVGIAIAAMILVAGVRHSFGVFFPAILDEFGQNRASTAIMFSLNIVVFGLLSPVAGILVDRWKPRLVFLIGIVIMGLATAACGFARELWHLYLLFGVLIPVGTAFSSWPILAPAIANWFARRVGLAMGLGQMGGGLSFVYGMLAELIISQIGWRQAYFTLAGILVVVLSPLCLFFHYRPESKGLKAYGTVEELPATDIKLQQIAVKSEPTLSYAIRRYELWLLALTHFLYWGLGVYLVLAHQVKFTEDVGYSSTFGAGILALFGIFVAAGQLSSSISDRIGREATVAIAATLAIIGLIALISVRDTSQPWLLYVYGICFGYGSGLYSPTAFSGAADIFHGRHFGAIAGILIAGMGMGGAIGPWLGGYIYDVSGSYKAAFIVVMVGLVFACFTYFMAAPRKAKIK
ncbi:MAG: MFS transporter [Chloroflexota bacterium]